MKNQLQTIVHHLDDDSLVLQRMSGVLEGNIRLLEKNLNAKIIRQRADFTVTSSMPNEVINVLDKLFLLAKERELTPEDIHLAAVEVHPASFELLSVSPEKMACTPDTRLKTGKKYLKGRTPRQSEYIRALQKYDVTFGIGPAGTGKTYIAVAAAVSALESHQIERIILVRPAVEAGEKLGFLPGDLSQKVDPYLRPLYDALYDFMGVEKVLRLLEKGVIEVAPLAYMRGRTLNSAFVILDEAQNTTKEQMKMFLTRIGFGTKAVITGDISQVDLPKHIKSGLKDAIDVLGNVEGVCFHYFKSSDVIRHPLVQKIVDAYDRQDEQVENK